MKGERYGSRVAGGRRHRGAVVEEVSRRYAANETQSEIAAALGCSQATVSRILRASGLVPPRGKAADRAWRKRRGIGPP